LFKLFFYLITDKMKAFGTRLQVFRGKARKTTGGLVKTGLTKNKRGKIVSKKMQAVAKKKSNLGQYVSQRKSVQKPVQQRKPVVQQRKPVQKPVQQRKPVQKPVQQRKPVQKPVQQRKPVQNAAYRRSQQLALKKQREIEADKKNRQGRLRKLRRQQKELRAVLPKRKKLTRKQLLALRARQPKRSTKITELRGRRTR